jgi:hypothetical protein
MVQYGEINGSGICKCLLSEWNHTSYLLLLSLIIKCVIDKGCAGKKQHKKAIEKRTSFSYYLKRKHLTIKMSLKRPSKHYWQGGLSRTRGRGQFEIIIMYTIPVHPTKMDITIMRNVRNFSIAKVTAEKISDMLNFSRECKK